MGIKYAFNETFDRLSRYFFCPGGVSTVINIWESEENVRHDCYLAEAQTTVMIIRTKKCVNHFYEYVTATWMDSERIHGPGQLYFGSDKFISAT